MVRAGREPPESDLQELDLSKPRWALRDWIAALGLFAATAGVVLWQNAHVAVLFDLSYILSTAARIALGQMPYRDFPLAHAPLTFLIQAAIIRLTGRFFFHHVLYVALIGGSSTVLTWRIALASLRGRVAAAWTVALVLAAPLTVLGIYCIVPNPEYDCDCAFWMLIALWLLRRIDAKTGVVGGFAAGAALCVPLFFKQNMGLPFLAAAIGAVLLVLAVKAFRRTQASAEPPETRTLLSVLAGACVALGIAVVALHWAAGLGNYTHWTIEYAGQRRLPGFSIMLGVYRDPSLLWTLPCVLAALALLWVPDPSRSFIARRLGSKLRWARIVAFALLAAPFLFTLASLLMYDDADERGDSLLALWPLLLLLAAALAIVKLLRLRRELSLRAFLPLVLLAAIHGAFLSQQLWGSTYGMSRCSYAEGSTRPARSGSPTRTCPTGRPRIPPFRSLPVWPRRDRICRRSTISCATLRPTFRLMTGWFCFPARNRSTLSPAACRASRCRSSIQPSIPIRPLRSRRWCARATSVGSL